MPLPEAFEGDHWTKKTARNIFPWLIWFAEHHETVFYSELDNEIVKRRIHKHVNFVQYGYPAGAVGDALLEIGKVWGETIPPLNALIVAKTGKEKGIPGDGCDWYLNNFLHKRIDFKKCSLDDKRAIISAVHDAIFSYKKWAEVQAYLSDVISQYPELSEFDGRFKTITKKSCLPTDDKSTVIRWNFTPPPKLREPSKPESDEHIALKRYVAAHPECVNLTKQAKSEMEYTFGSGDCADVVFTLDDKLTIVEVKSRISDENDMCRGVFQCVKYRALARAHQKLKRVIPNGDAILVLENPITPKVREYAEKLSVTWFDLIEPT